MRELDIIILLVFIVVNLVISLTIAGLETKSNWSGDPKQLRLPPLNLTKQDPRKLGYLRKMIYFLCRSTARRVEKKNGILTVRVLDT